jgi:hypothetical protein
MDSRSILLQFGIFYGHLVYFVVIWDIFSRFGMLYQEKSGNPASQVYVLHFSAWHQRSEDCTKAAELSTL